MAITEQERARRAAFGRGIIEGVRMAGIHNPEQYVNSSRLEQKLESITALERKVFEATPLSEAWTASQIVRELLRQSVPVSTHQVNGALHHLAQMKLVREPERGHFMRDRVKPAKADKAPPLESTPAEAEPMPEPKSATQPADCLTRLANLAVLLRRAADEAEAVALDVEEEKRSLSRDSERLRQLQALLKGGEV